MTKILYVLLFLIIFLVALMFSLLNLDPVKIYFYKGLGVELPLALVLTLELLAGVVIGYSVRFLRYMRLSSECNRLRKELVAAEQEIENLEADLE